MSEENLHSLPVIDERGFRTIFDYHFKALCAFAYRYVPDTLVVEDLVQEVFIVFWEKRQNFDHEKAVKAFLYTSVRNRCLNHLKRQTMLQKHEEKLVYELESESFFTQHVIEEEVFNQLHAEIGHLPESAQKIMLLALKGLGNKEIASALNISENTVKTQKKIAYRKLKTKLSSSMQAILLSL